MKSSKRGVTEKGKKAKRFYGWGPDLPDDRDYLHSALRRRVVRLPKSVDLRAQCSNVEDQVIWAAVRQMLLQARLNFLKERTRLISLISAGYSSATMSVLLNTAQNMIAEP